MKKNHSLKTQKKNGSRSKTGRLGLCKLLMDMNAPGYSKKEIKKLMSILNIGDRKIPSEVFEDLVNYYLGNQTYRELKHLIKQEIVFDMIAADGLSVLYLKGHVSDKFHEKLFQNIKLNVYNGYSMYDFKKKYKKKLTKIISKLKQEDYNHVEETGFINCVEW